jgi:nucleoside-diphosphate-sugar epimerase
LTPCSPGARRRSPSPRASFGVGDIRDVTDLHILTMAAPEAAGKRLLAVTDGPTITDVEVADILRRRLSRLAERVPREEAPLDDLTRPIIHNDRARNELRWTPRAARGPSWKRPRTCVTAIL